jgi:hypothetical protein
MKQPLLNIVLLKYHTIFFGGVVQDAKDIPNLKVSICILIFRHHCTDESGTVNRSVFRIFKFKTRILKQLPAYVTCFGFVVALVIAVA